MPRSNPPSVVQDWLSRRWYRLWILIAAGMLLSFGAVSLVLFAIPQTTWPITTGAVNGLLCAFLFGLIQAAVSMVGVMRCSTPFRGTLAVLIPTLVVAMLGHLPINLDLQVIPIVLTYCIGFGSLATALACRWHFGEELVARGNRVLRSSSPAGEAGMAVFMLLFCWTQYKHLGGWYVTHAAPLVLGWATVLSISTAWGFVALSRFGERRRAYAVAIPTGVVAVFALYLQFRKDGMWTEPWSGFLAFAAATPIGWCASQELATRSLAAYGWKWRRIRKACDARGLTYRDRSVRKQIQLTERSWLCIATLFLVVVAISTLYLHSDPVLNSRYSWRYLAIGVSALNLGIGWACICSIIILVAQQRGSLIYQCLVSAVALFAMTAIRTSKLNYNLFEGANLKLDAALIAVAVAVTVHLLVRSLDQFSDASFGNVDRKRERIGILMF